MALISEEWNVKDSSDNDERKKIMLICNGPPLDYYMFPLGWAGKVNFSGLLREQDVKPSQGNVMDPCEGHGSNLPSTICRKKKNLESVFLRPVAVGSELHPSGSKLETLGVSRWPGTWSRMDVCMCMCVWVEGLTHTRVAPLSADSENMFAWDKSTKTHPSTGSKYALRHCWHGVNNLTLTEVGEARGRMESETEREMDRTVIDIQFELLQIFPFSRKLSTLWSVHAAGQVRVIFPACCTQKQFDQNCLQTNCVHFQWVLNVAEMKTSRDVSPHDLVFTSEYCFRTK